LTSKVKANKNGIGIFGGSFDPPHKGHLKISKVSLNRLKLKKLHWLVTKKNPFKKSTYFSLEERIIKCSKMLNKYKKIKVEYLENKLKSSRTISIIRYFKKKNKKTKIYLIIDSDNLIHFNKWKNWKEILRICELVVFSRKGYDKKAKKSVIISHLKNKNITFIKDKKICISSSEIRKKL